MSSASSASEFNVKEEGCPGNFNRIDRYSLLMDTKFNDIDNFCLELEKKLNVIGYVPFVGTWSAMLRKALGVAQMVAGVAVFLFAGISRLCHRNDPQKAALYDSLIKKSMNYIGQGALNFGRGCLESFWFGVIVTLPFDLTGRKILRYPTEEADYKRNIGCIEELGERARALAPSLMGLGVSSVSIAASSAG